MLVGDGVDGAFGVGEEPGGAVGVGSGQLRALLPGCQCRRPARPAMVLPDGSEPSLAWLARPHCQACSCNFRLPPDREPVTPGAARRCREDDRGLAEVASPATRRFRAAGLAGALGAALRIWRMSSS